jgi:hypothetical protein
MVILDASKHLRSNVLLEFVAAWWLVSATLSLLLAQPFDALLLVQSSTSHLTAYNPWVTVSNLAREQHVLAGALATTSGLLLLSTLCTQVPYTLVLVTLTKPRSTRRNTVLRGSRVYPHVAVLALLNDAVPVLFLYVCLNAHWSWLLDATPVSLWAGFAIAVALFTCWLVFLTVVDLARLSVAHTAGRAPLVQSLAAACCVLARAPLKLILQSTTARAVSLFCLGVSLAGSFSIARWDAPGVPLLAWLVTQIGVLLGLVVRVTWLASATEHVYNLRPPSLSN